MTNKKMWIMVIALFVTVTGLAVAQTYTNSANNRLTMSFNSSNGTFVVRNGSMEAAAGSYRINGNQLMITVNRGSREQVGRTFVYIINGNEFSSNNGIMSGNERWVWTSN